MVCSARRRSVGLMSFGMPSSDGTLMARWGCIGAITLAVCGITRPGVAQEIFVRPHAGIGYATSFGAGDSGWITHAGGRVLLSANGTQSYGLEASYIDVHESNGNRQFVAVGVVLEQRRWECFNMSIGTIGYVGLGQNHGNPFGLVTNLGWEPHWGRWSPFVTYRGDWIFRSPILEADSLSAGVTIRL